LIVNRTINGVECQYESDTHLWLIKCTVCNNKFSWQVPKPVVVVSIAAPPAAPIMPQTQIFSAICPNKKSVANQLEDCKTHWRIVVDPAHELDSNGITGIQISPEPDTDVFWTEFARKKVSDSLDLLDKRSEYMITTIAALVAVNFGVLLAFDVKFTVFQLGFTIKIAPQVLLAISAGFFAISHFALKKIFYVESPDSVRRTYEEWLKHKYYWQKWGYGFFVAGLFFIGITYLISKTSP
jgi:hypothetical protein